MGSWRSTILSLYSVAAVSLCKDRLIYVIENLCFLAGNNIWLWFCVISKRGSGGCLRLSAPQTELAIPESQYSLFWLLRCCGMTPFSLDSPSHCLILSISFPSLHPSFQSAAIREAKWERRNVWARFVRTERKKRAREGDRWREGNEKKETEEERRRKEWRKTILIGLCGHVELWWSEPAKPCANSWPGLTCIPCIRPTTSNSSVLFGSFQCQGWRSFATHIYTLLHSSGSLFDKNECTGCVCMIHFVKSLLVGFVNLNRTTADVCLRVTEMTSHTVYLHTLTRGNTSSHSVFSESICTTMLLTLFIFKSILFFFLFFLKRCHNALSDLTFLTVWLVSVDLCRARCCHVRNSDDEPWGQASAQIHF